MSVENRLTSKLPIAECVSFLLIKEGACLLERRSAMKASDPNIIAIPRWSYRNRRKPNTSVAA